MMIEFCDCVYEIYLDLFFLLVVGLDFYFWGEFVWVEEKFVVVIDGNSVFFVIVCEVRFFVVVV